VDAILLCPASPLLAVPALVLLHVAIHRLTGRRSIIRSFLAAWVLAGAGYAALRAAAAGTGAGAVGGVVADAIVYTGIAYVYADFVSFGASSVRVRILDEIARRPGGIATPDLLARYDARAVISTRIARLLDDGQLARAGARLVLGPNRGRQLLLGRVFVGLRRLLFGTGATTSRAIRERVSSRTGPGRSPPAS